ncbi:hypothetical protein EOD39_14733 [Acipenser ruthenus]|uniref:Uncharacterized protein n=1 Tax=Acipenser ruthenus TaxID=7906 RepID=A0A662YKY0_ACIRT|nr:hypothetical protein EOD39_14733 [Acipenser ruthenus]
MLLRGAQGRRTRLRRQEVPARLQRLLEWPQPPPPMPEYLEPLPLEELELLLPEWPSSPPAVPEGLSAVPEGPPSPPVVPEASSGGAGSVNLYSRLQDKSHQVSRYGGDLLPLN